jgi:hypothetical protein
MDNQPRCSKCNDGELGHLDSLLDSGKERLDVSYQALGSIRYHTPKRSDQGEYSERSKLAKAIRTPERTKAGTVEAYVCTRCGHLERFVQDPRWMPFSKLEGFSWVNGPPGGAADEEVPR